MDLNQAFSFLKKHQPLPSDDELNSEDINTLEEVRKYFLENPNPNCIPLFLNVFGSGSGFGIYQLIEDVIVQFSNEDVTPHLLNSLRSEYQGVRYWSAQIALSFPEKRLIESLSAIVNDKDPELRVAAYMALGEIHDKSVLLILDQALINETDQENLEILNDIINNYED